MKINPKVQKLNTNTAANAEGFTLIELSIVILISALIFIPLINMYQAYYKKQFIEKTLTNIDLAQSVIGTFSSARYPCPADPSLGPTDAGYGLEQVDASGDCITAPGKVVAVAGARTAAQTVVIGAIPVRTLKLTTSAAYLPDESSLDGWGNKLLYAVTTSQTKASTYVNDEGQIAAIDEGTPPRATAGINGDAHFVVLSHGSNGNGAYTNGGVLISACVATVKEGENCDADSTFMSALGFYEGDSPDYFDDVTYFAQRFDNELWANTAAGSIHIYNKNTGNVGIKTATPTEKLDVNGDLKAANNTKVTQICDYTGAKCFNVSRISGTGMACPVNQVMVGITNGNPDCVAVAVTPPANVDCQAIGKWVQGIRSDGAVICTP